MNLQEIRAKYPQYSDLSDHDLADGIYNKFYSDMPREAFNAKIGLAPDKWRTGNILPLATNERTGEVSPAIPGMLRNITDLATGKTPIQAPDPVTGEVHAGPGAIAGATDTAGLIAGAAPAKLLAAEGGRVAGDVAGSIAAKLPERAPPKVEVPVPTASEWQTTKSLAYKEVDDSGARYSQTAFDRLVDQIDMRARGDKLNPMRHPKAASMLDELKAARGSAPTLTELDQWRQVVRRDVKGDEAEGHFGELMVDAVDDFISSATMKDMAGGDPRAAANAILKARSANAKYKKLEAIEDALEKAQRQTSKAGSGGNIDNAIRQQIDKILNNKKLSRFYSREEKAAMKKVVDGDSMQNFARLVGKLSPEGNGLALLLHALTGISTGGTSALAQIPLAIGGFAAKRYADKATRQNVDDLSRLIGGQ